MQFMRRWIACAVVGWLLAGNSFAAKRPNIIVFFADDAGYADFGFQGGGIDGDFAELTPHIDALAESGVHFTNGYVSAAVCTPSRAGLLTGRYQHRFGVETVYGRIPEAGLPATEITVANIVRKAGYRTYALGKWHLGEHLPEHLPNQRGFDEFYGVLTGARTFFPYRGNNDASKLQQNGVFLPEPPDQPYFTDLLARQTAAYIDEHVANYANDPFFVYLAFTAVHTPLEADAERLADPRIRNITPSQRKTLAAMTIAMDDAVGTVMAKLRESGVIKNTIVVFLSDNGGPEDNQDLRAPNWSDNGVLRGNKSLNFEGGIRVPFVIHWPDGLAPALVGKALPDVVTALDLLPTFAEVAKAALPEDREIDGLSLVSRLRGKSSALPERTHFWRQVQQKAVRKGDWKLYQANRSSAPELYHLATDIEETKNLAATKQRKLAELQTAYAEWEKDMIEPLWNYRGMRTTSNAPTAPPRRQTSNLETTFRRLDRNGDGRVTRQELPRAEIFDRFDRNGDGVIQASEVGIRSRPAAAPEIPANPKVENRLSDSTAFLDLEFTRDWIPGSRDAGGRWMGGTETNYLVVHDQKLFASIGAWNADREAPGFAGPMVLVKEKADEPWQVDFNAGRRSVRIAALTSLEITTDGQGRRLNQPIHLLAGGVSGFEYPGEVTVFIRNDATGDWEKSVVTRRDRQRGGEIRHLFDHIDAVTGVHHVFATASGGELYRASYDPEAPGRLRWHPEPELTGRLARIMSHVVANGQLYLAIDITPSAPKNGGLFRRVDGEEPRWEWLGEWGSRTQHVGVAWIRGMTAIADPTGSGRDVILASRETDGVIDIIDPSTSPPKRKIDFDFKAHFAAVLEAPDASRIDSIIAYNEMTPAVHPETGEKIHFLTGGARAVVPRSRRGISETQAFLLMRHTDGSYATVRIPAVADEDSLRCARTIVPSPFPEETGRVWYLGGFDAAQGPHENTAWIYKGTLSDR